MRTITAKFSGKCVCGGTISVDDRILFADMIVGCPGCRPDEISRDLSVRGWGNAVGSTTVGQRVRRRAAEVATDELAVEHWSSVVACTTDAIKLTKYKVVLAARQATLAATRKAVLTLPRSERPSVLDIENAIRNARAEQAKRDAERAEEAN